MSESKTTPSTESTDGQAPAEMAESGETPEQDQTEAPQTGETPAQDAGESAHEDNLQKALKAERDARKKAEKELASLKKNSEAGLSETERLAQRVTELEAAKAAAERDALAMKVATEMGLPPALAARLHGTDEDSLRDDAKALLDSIPAPKKSDTVGGPQGSPSNGRSPEDWVKVLRERR